MKWLLLKTKILLLKLGIRKDVAASVYKDAMNKNSKKWGGWRGGGWGALKINDEGGPTMIGGNVSEKFEN